jgi:hypothetical protein
MQTWNSRHNVQVQSKQLWGWGIEAWNYNGGSFWLFGNSRRLQVWNNEEE